MCWSALATSDQRPSRRRFAPREQGHFAGERGDMGVAEGPSALPRPPARLPAGRRPGITPESGHLRGAAAAAGTEGLEAAQLPGVSGDHRQAGVAVQLQPLEELGDRLGERDRGCGRLGHPRVSISPLKRPRRPPAQERCRGALHRSPRRLEDVTGGSPHRGASGARSAPHPGTLREARRIARALRNEETRAGRG